MNHSLIKMHYFCSVQDLERARQHHQNQLEIAQELQDRAAQGRASSNLGRFDGGS